MTCLLQTILIDGRGHLLGRLAAVVAKTLLEGLFLLFAASHNHLTRRSTLQADESLSFAAKALIFRGVSSGTNVSLPDCCRLFSCPSDDYKDVLPDRIVTIQTQLTMKMLLRPAYPLNSHCRQLLIRFSLTNSEVPEFPAEEV